MGTRWRTQASAVALSLPALSLFACGVGSGEGSRALISVDGSSTVFPIAEAVSEDFQLGNPQVMVTPGRSGTGGGFDRFCRGETDISTASRTIQGPESALCAGQGVGFLELPVALDGLSVIVSRRNDFVDCLTVEELRSIWRPGSRVRTWRDVRPEFPGREIRLYGPGTESGSYDTFTAAIVGEGGASRTDFQASEDDNVLVLGVSGDPYALGFTGFAYLAGNRTRLKALGVDGGGGCVQPTPNTIQHGIYLPLSRPLFLYVKLSSLEKPSVRSFLHFFMTRAPVLIPQTGFVSLPDSLYRDNLERLTRAAGTPLSSEVSQEGRSPGGD